MSIMKVKKIVGVGFTFYKIARLLNPNSVFEMHVYLTSAEVEKARNDFDAKFKAKFNADVQVYAPYVYDSVNLMVAAMVKAGSSDPAKYLPVLAATKGYQGVTGAIGFDAKGDILDGALTLKTVRGGKLDTISVIR
jgi:branched-chain amino acid transport system substrate-binding protein